MTLDEWNALSIGQTIHAPYSGRFYRIRGSGKGVHKADEFSPCGQILHSFIDLTYCRAFEVGIGDSNGKCNNTGSDSE